MNWDELDELSEELDQLIQAQSDVAPQEVIDTFLETQHGGGPWLGLLLEQDLERVKAPEEDRWRLMSVEEEPHATGVPIYRFDIVLA